MDSGTAVGAGIGTLVYLVLLVVFIAAEWTVFQKAGKPGWAVLIPIYNTLVFLQIIGRPWWWFLLFFVPLVNIVVGIIALIDLARSFGKGGGFAVGLIFLAPIFLLILAFGGARYVGPGGQPQPRPSFA